MLHLLPTLPVTPPPNERSFSTVASLST